MKLKVKQDVCIGCGGCVSICDQVYNFNDDGLAEVIVTPVPEALEAQAQEGKEYCPVGAIVEEE